MIPMIPLIDCSSDDANRYYHNTLVFYEGRPVLFDRCVGSNVAIVEERGSGTARYRDLRSTIFDPFYSTNGEYFGHTANRRTSRSIPVPIQYFPDVVSMIALGDVPRYIYNDGTVRMNKDFRTQLHRGVLLLCYRGDYVGFIEEDTHYVQSPFIKERLEDLFHGISVSVFTG